MPGGVLRILALAAALSAVVPAHAAAIDRPGPAVREAAATRALDRVRSDPVRLREFLQAMPKGADLHNHATGTVYAESLIRYGIADGMCISTLSWTSSAPPCEGANVESLGTAVSQGAWDAIVDAWSMRNIEKYPVSGHDRFFDAFAKFGAISERRLADVVADDLRQADEDHVAYVEIMAGFGEDAVRRVAGAVRYGGDLNKLRADVAAAGLDGAVAAADTDVRAVDAGVRSALGCERHPHALGCAVEYRFIMQVVRTLPVESVFTQTAVAVGLIARNARVVALNYVAPEDDRVALADYGLHMRIVRLLADPPRTHVSLHAGELTLGLVPLSALRGHIRDAVEIAHAERIGHGVDIAYEDDRERTLAEMKQRHVLVEVNLTSNAVILGVAGKAHPLALYLRAGVPVALSTDDEGVSRIDFTNEFERAVQTYGFGYPRLEQFVRNSLEYSFLPGASLWRDRDYRAMTPACAGDDPLGAPSVRCGAYLRASAKANQQWRVEHELARFEAGLI